MNTNLSKDSTHVLIEVIEQEISEPAFFNSAEAAKAEMLKRLKDAASLTDDDLEKAERPYEGCSAVYVDENTFFDAASARCEVYGNNHDWRIFEL